MKRTHIIPAVLLFSLAAASMIGSGASALGNASSTKTGTENYCARFSALSQKYEQNVTKQITDLRDRVQTQTQKVQTNRADFDAKLAQHRQQWTQNRQSLYARLNGRAKTDVEKQAVATFRSAIETAVTIREQSVDAARSAYRQAADQLISQHRTMVEQVLDEFQSSIRAAITQAQKDCSSGTAPVQVRAAFRQALEAARQARKSGVGEIDKTGPQMEQLAQVRNAAIQQAINAYRNSLHAAVSALRQAFGESKSVPTTTPVPAATTTPNAT